MPSRTHLPEYLCEFLGTATMLFIGVGAITLIWGTGSPMPEMIPHTRLRLLLTGLLFAGGATMVVYSRLGQRSGAHINPAVTLAFWRMGKVAGGDAAAYVAAQVLGAVAGVGAVAALGGEFSRSVRYGMTAPGEGISPWVALAAEVGITFLLVTLILHFVNRPRIAPRTGIAAGLLVALLVVLVAPISGTSLNPARSVGPAVWMNTFEHLWIYLLAPPLGALGAVALFRLTFPASEAHLCAKLYHTERYSCIFADCGYHRVSAGEVLLHEGEASDRAFVIDRGELEIRKRRVQGEVVLARLGPGQWVGELGLLLGRERTASVVAVTDAQLRPITPENFIRVIRENPEATLEVMRQMAERLAEADRKLVL